jgi:hypothetical protein
MTRRPGAGHQSARQPATPTRISSEASSYTDIDLGIRGRAIGLLARVLYPDLPP